MKAILYIMLSISILGFFTVKGLLKVGKKVAHEVFEEVFSDKYFIKDGNVYFHDDIGSISKSYSYKMDDADTASFQLLEPKSRREGDHHIYARDSRHYYRDQYILPNANPDEFIIGKNLMEITKSRKKKIKKRSSFT